MYDDQVQRRPLPARLLADIASAPETHDPEPPYLESDGPMMTLRGRIVSKGVEDAEREAELSEARKSLDDARQEWLRLDRLFVEADRKANEAVREANALAVQRYDAEVACEDAQRQLSILALESEALRGS